MDGAVCAPIEGIDARRIYVEFGQDQISESNITWSNTHAGVRQPYLKIALPRGTRIGGADVSGATFLRRFTFESHIHRGMQVVSFDPDDLVRISIPERTRRGGIVGYTTLYVSAAELASAIAAANDQDDDFCDDLFRTMQKARSDDRTDVGRPLGYDEGRSI